MNELNVHNNTNYEILERIKVIDWINYIIPIGTRFC